MVALSRRLPSNFGPSFGAAFGVMGVSVSIFDPVRLRHRAGVYDSTRGNRAVASGWRCELLPLRRSDVGKFFSRTLRHFSGEGGMIARTADELLAGRRAAAARGIGQANRPARDGSDFNAETIKHFINSTGPFRLSASTHQCSFMSTHRHIGASTRSRVFAAAHPSTRPYTRRYYPPRLSSHSASAAMITA
jgi:hypothetical protein